MNRAATRIAAWALAGSLAAAPAEAASEGPEPRNPHGNFRADCNICHVPEGWKPAKIGLDFDHSRFGFTLEGAHADTPCLLCHLNLEFSQVAGTRCDECHQDVHAGELGSECQRCHSTKSFIDRTDDLRSHRFTRFPLTGVHATVECSVCHKPGESTAMRFVNTPVECIDCHLASYQAATPAHTLESFPASQCGACHTTFEWSSFGGAGFDHSLTGFPLTGAHRAAACAGCHAGNQFTGASSDCYSCHASDYNSASPNHASSGFGTNCATCHSTSGWSGAGAENHDELYFPIYSGKHKGKWTDCATCHTQPLNFSVFTCLDCHRHSASKENSRHREVSGYSYDSNACYSCHPRGTK